MFFFFNDTATTEIYTLSLHDALPICGRRQEALQRVRAHLLVLYLLGTMLYARRHRKDADRLLKPRALVENGPGGGGRAVDADRKSTRLNSSHANISYAVFCLKKKKM